MTRWNRTIGNASLRTIGAALVSLLVLPRAAFPFPLEKFDHQLDVTCAADSSCARSVRAKTTLGAYTGIWVRGGDEMRSKLSISKGVLVVQATGPLLSSIQLSWDSDPYADQLSSAGLKCIDMRHQDGSAIVIKDFELLGVCGEDDAPRECSPYVVETRIYDSVDPTGQTYSASILRRANGRESQDLIIPFSNFNRKGLRGEGRIGCAGAVAITVRTDGYRDVKLRAGPIFTNSSEPFEALVLTPTPTMVPATPTMTGSVPTAATETPPHTPSAAARETSMSMQPTAAAGTESLEQHEQPSSPKPSLPGDEVVVAPLTLPQPQEVVEEETVYGAIVSD